jgi:hypothetical protein
MATESLMVIENLMAAVLLLTTQEAEMVELERENHMADIVKGNLIPIEILEVDIALEDLPNPKSTIRFSP